jgi:hypothetical protein
MSCGIDWASLACFRPTIVRSDRGKTVTYLVVLMFCGRGCDTLRYWSVSLYRYCPWSAKIVRIRELKMSRWVIELIGCHALCYERQWLSLVLRQQLMSVEIGLTSRPVYSRSNLKLTNTIIQAQDLYIFAIRSNGMIDGLPHWHIVSMMANSQIILRKRKMEWTHLDHT